MAPTTMPGQVTTTSPAGRDVNHCGYPIRVVELLATLRTPAYLVRVSAHDEVHLVQAKQAIRKAFRYQLEGRCFSFVEVLSICPTNWGLSPAEASQWLANTMIPYYPLGEIKTPDDGPVTEAHHAQ